MTSISLIIPTYNEEEILEKTVKKVLKIGNKWKKFEVVIADNASTDRTLDIAKKLSKSFNNVCYIHLDKKGRGRVLKKTWSDSNSDVVAYMDADLSTDLKHFPELIDGIIKEGYDICIGSRLLKESDVRNRPKIREFLSRSYNFLIKILFRTSFHDAQCGFKAVKKGVIKKLIPKIKDNSWFFDSEMLIIAEKSGYRIKEIPVKWVDDPRSAVKILKTSLEDLKGLLRLKWERPWG